MRATGGVAIAALLIASGCAVDPLDRLAADLDANPDSRTSAARELADMTNRESLERLIESFRDYPDTRETTAAALVYRGREWKAQHPNLPKGRMNGVVTRLGEVAADRHLGASVRAKAVWCLAEIGDRRAKPCITSAYGADSMAVQAEVTVSLQKLGFTEEAHGMELLRNWETVSTYDPQERGHEEETDD